MITSSVGKDFVFVLRTFGIVQAARLGCVSSFSDIHRFGLPGRVINVFVAEAECCYQSAQRPTHSLTRFLCYQNGHKNIFAGSFLYISSITEKLIK